MASFELRSQKMTNNEELLTVARTNGAYGVRGWIRIVPFEDGEVLALTKRWWFTDMRGETRIVHVSELKVHGNALLAKFEGVDNKEDADRMRGRISVLREDFPELDDDEHWAVDILGCKVVNREGVEIGTVVDIGDNGVQDILKIEAPKQSDRAGKIYLIPVVEQYVDEMDTDSGLIKVDWQPDWY